MQAKCGKFAHFVLQNCMRCDTIYSIFSRQAFIDSIINDHLNTICETAISNTKITVIAIQGFQNIQLHSRNTDAFSGLYICKFKNIFAVAHGNRISYYTGVP